MKKENASQTNSTQLSKNRIRIIGFATVLKRHIYFDKPRRHISNLNSVDPTHLPGLG